MWFDSIYVCVDDEDGVCVCVCVCILTSDHKMNFSFLRAFPIALDIETVAHLPQNKIMSVAERYRRTASTA